MGEDTHETPATGRHRPRGTGRPRVERSLRLRVRIYAAIVVVSLAVVAVDVVGIGGRAAVPVVTGLAGGLLAGVVASRMSRLAWDADSASVVGRIDALGAVILVAYVLLVVFRGALLARWFDPALVGVAGVSVLAGLMLGQVVGTVRGIVRVSGILRGHPPEEAGPHA